MLRRRLSTKKSTRKLASVLIKFLAPFVLDASRAKTKSIKVRAKDEEREEMTDEDLGAMTTRDEDLARAEEVEIRVGAAVGTRTSITKRATIVTLVRSPHAASATTSLDK